MDGDPSDVGRQLYRLGAELRRRVQVELEADDWLSEKKLPPLAIAVLRLVDGAGATSQREIADALVVDPSDLVAILDRLEDAGFIERRRDPEDRRRNLVVATPDGVRASERLLAVAERAHGAALARLGERERAQLARLIRRALGDS